jgi:AcrR family transcriptional regulator
MELYMVSSLQAISGDTSSRILEAALARVRANQGAGLTMAEVAAQAGVSRQAVYLHFADRAALLLALLRHVEAGRGVKLAAIAHAPSARAAVTAMVALQAGDNPGLWPVARVFDSLRPSDPAMEAAWQERLADRLQSCRVLAERFQQEGALAPHLSLDAAADLLWTLTALRLWEDLVIGRGWSADRYRSHVTYLAVGAVTK